jgi:hypothetical protein
MKLIFVLVAGNSVNKKLFSGDDSLLQAQTIKPKTKIPFFIVFNITAKNLDSSVELYLAFKLINFRKNLSNFFWFY